MTHSIRTTRALSSPATSPATQVRRTAALLSAVSAVSAFTLTAVFAVDAHAQQSTNPGDIVVERTITPRDAFIPVPKSQDPVAVNATTFPANSFNPAIAQLVGDTDLTNAHGSSGVAEGGVLGGTGMQAVTQILSGKATGSNVALNAGGIGMPGPGIGGTITSSVTGALAPLSNALSGSLGGLK
ncbi:hypothetical protein LFL96_14470 [Paraburkholderia sp. D15]|uniref:hypothetical protein n=1 Tax=Paraburkholderia sp. D15 TaxID=2880218 RepID=UPI002478F802|nr:hypothetical protein [Paraburkholderia sp. D15]WGS48967.1 hypothetical protein LFL96_14470 [Paraburkholderia sp. D15]WKF56856.1 hypothetical protein HUO10_001327 [Paraburkholderia busanensis]